MASTATGGIEFSPPPSSPPPLQPLSPIQLSGFLSGDTVQVQGDTQNFQFSLQFNVHPKVNSGINHPLFPATIMPGTQTYLSSSSSSYRTPPVTSRTHEDEEQIGKADEIGNVNMFDRIKDTEEYQGAVREENRVVTRLRSGVLSPVNYYPRPNTHSWTKGKSAGKGDVLDRVLRRHSLPIRPCSSYTFFVMANWGSVRAESPLTFGEKSKKLSRMWCELSQPQKRVFEDMASKDAARYKRQFTLLRCRED